MRQQRVMAIIALKELELRALADGQQVLTEVHQDVVRRTGAVAVGVGERLYEEARARARALPLAPPPPLPFPPGPAQPRR